MAVKQPFQAKTVQWCNKIPGLPFYCLLCLTPPAVQLFHIKTIQLKTNSTVRPSLNFSSL